MCDRLVEFCAPFVVENILNTLVNEQTLSMPKIRVGRCTHVGRNRVVSTERNGGAERARR